MNKTSLRRYTSLPILFDMLANKKITLLDPTSWEDRNDSFYVERYREKKQFKTVLALCFTTKRETFHQWKVFAGNSSGVCIRFSDDKLMACFDHNHKIRTGYVAYRLMRDLEHNPPTVDELPFIKRRQYEDEAEFRILYEDRKKELQTKAFVIDLKCIDRITLSPWLPPNVAKTVKNVIWQMPGCSTMNIIRTGVIENRMWKKVANRLA